MKSPTSNWFGDAFSELDPLLQKLHLQGGKLSGTVKLNYPAGLSGLIGKRIGSKIGLPKQAGYIELDVEITHKPNQLIWSRTFNKSHKMISIFEPHGSYPEGYWSETTGKLSLELGVEIKNHGWHWVQRKVKFLEIPLPLFLFPSSHAYKTINNGKYEFSVVFSLPILGELLSYKGELSANKNA